MPISIAGMDAVGGLRPASMAVVSRGSAEQTLDQTLPQQPQQMSSSKLILSTSKCHPPRHGPSFKPLHHPHLFSCALCRTFCLPARRDPCLCNPPLHACVLSTRPATTLVAHSRTAHCVPLPLCLHSLLHLLSSRDHIDLCCAPHVHLFPSQTKFCFHPQCIVGVSCW